MAGELAYDPATGQLVYSPATGQLALNCAGGPSTDCDNWGTNCFDGDELAEPPVDPSDLPLAATWTPDEGVPEAADPDPVAMTMQIAVWGMEYRASVSFAGGGFDLALSCVTGKWTMDAFGGGGFADYLGGATPSLTCANGKYPTGTVTVLVYEDATFKGTLTLTLGP